MPLRPRNTACMQSMQTHGVYWRTQALRGSQGKQVIVRLRPSTLLRQHPIPGVCHCSKSCNSYREGA